MKKITSLLFAFLMACTVFIACTSSDDESDDTNNNLPALSAVQLSAITTTSAIASASVSSGTGSEISDRGFVYDTSASPTLSDNKVSSMGETPSFSGALVGLTANTTYYIRAYATNDEGTAYSAETSFTTTTVTTGIATVTTTSASAISQTGATSGGNVTADGGAAITQRGIAYGTTQNPTVSGSHVTSTGTTGAFVSSITGLTAATTYYVRAYATNANGTAYGNQITFTTSAAVAGPTGGSAICDGSRPTQVVTVTSSTGKIWMDRNLGASRAATSSKDYEAYGCLYQWGRGNDGHASITWTMGQPDGWGGQPGTAVNASTYTLSTTDNPGHALFIKDQTSIPYDWRSPKNDNLWQGVNGINNPCPAGFRVPTRAEYQAEIAAYSITNPTGAYNSIHKFVLAGDRAFDSGAVRGGGEEIFLWTSTVDGGDAHRVMIKAGSAVYTNGVGRAGGYSVRCIKN
ncbi:MAG: hypothetical protein IR153_10400 [Flavobacterium sp.]|nr:hypothetical protein [Flavobacterium sp.]